MPFFRYSGTDKSGGSVSGTVEANSADDAMLQLVNSGVNVSQLMKSLAPGAHQPAAKPVEPPKVVLTTPAPPVAPKPKPVAPPPPQKAAPKGPVVRTKPVSDKDRMFLFSQLSKQLKAGIGLAAALSDLRMRIAREMSPSIEEASKDATNGSPISDTFERYPDLYPEYVVGLVRAGEQGGFLAEACQVISDQAESAHLFKRSFWWLGPLLINAIISLPLTVLIMQALVKTWKIVENKGEDASMGVALSALGKSVLIEFLWPIGPLTLGLLGISVFFYKKFSAPERKLQRHELALRWPVFGARTKHECLAVFSWTMSKLAKGGASPKKSWDLATDAVPNLAVRERLLRVGKALSGSEKLSNALFNENFFPQEYAPIIATAEQTGDMPGAFDQLAKISQGDFDAAQNSAKAKSAGWGRAGCLAVGGLIIILLIWAFWYELAPAILNGLE